MCLCLFVSIRLTSSLASAGALYAKHACANASLVVALHVRAFVYTLCTNLRIRIRHFCIMRCGTQTAALSKHRTYTNLIHTRIYRAISGNKHIKHFVGLAAGSLTLRDERFDRTSASHRANRFPAINFHYPFEWNHHYSNKQKRPRTRARTPGQTERILPHRRRDGTHAIIAIDSNCASSHM